MNSAHSPLSISATTSPQITQLMNTDILILDFTSVQIRSDRGKTLKFAEVAQICEFCESHDARKKRTALCMICQQ